jgi:xanthine dehydrogenase small subunit
MAAMAQDFQPLTDWRAGSEYRMLASQNLLQRFYLETTTTEPVQVDPHVATVPVGMQQATGEADGS